MKIDSVLREVLGEIVLSEREEKRIERLAEEVLSKMKKVHKNVFVGGSVAKRTMVKKDKQDVDLFVVFDSEEETKNLGMIVSRVFDVEFERVHGSRDYFRVFYDDVVFEIIPVVKFDKKHPENVENVTDFSLSHVDYVRKKISKNKKLADEIKLAKTFCRANRCYGAESYIGGFSGYALEVLVIHFGSFKKFLKKILKERVVDPEKFFRNKREIFMELNKSKLDSPVVLIDPTYRYRNVCAGLKEETFGRFLVVARDFLKSPSKDFFSLREVDLDSLRDLAREKKADFVEVSLSCDRAEESIAASKMKKFFNFVVYNLEKKQQKVLVREFVFLGGEKKKKAKGYLVVLPQEKVIVGGVDKRLGEAVKEFKKSHKKTFVKGGRVYAYEVISLEDVFDFLKKFEEDMGVEFEVVF